MLGIILAGGEGTRFARSGCCKPLLKINGRYLIEYALDYLSALSAEEVLVVVGKYGDEIAAAIGDAYRTLPVSYVRQERPLGLVNALYTAALHVEARETALLLGDELLIGPSFPTAEQIASADFLCGYTVPEDPETIKENYAVDCLADGTILSAEEKPRRLINEKKGTGCCIFNSACIETLLSACAEDAGAGADLCDYINLLLSEGKRGLAVRVAAEEININNQKSFRYAKRLLEGLA